MAANTKIYQKYVILPLKMMNHHINPELIDGLKSEFILYQIIIYGSHNVLSPSNSQEGYQLLILMRSYLELDMYASLTTHTEATLVKGQEELVIFNNALKVFSTIII